MNASVIIGNDKAKVVQPVEAITFVADTVKRKLNSLTWNEALLLTSKPFQNKIKADFERAETLNAGMVAEDWAASNRGRGVRDYTVPRNG